MSDLEEEDVETSTLNVLTNTNTTTTPTGTSSMSPSLVSGEGEEEDMNNASIDIGMDITGSGGIVDDNDTNNNDIQNDSNNSDRNNDTPVVSTSDITSTSRSSVPADEFHDNPVARRNSKASSSSESAGSTEGTEVQTLAVAAAAVIEVSSSTEEADSFKDSPQFPLKAATVTSTTITTTMTVKSSDNAQPTAVNAKMTSLLDNAVQQEQQQQNQQNHNQQQDVAVEQTVTTNDEKDKAASTSNDINEIKSSDSNNSSNMDKETEAAAQMAAVAALVTAATREHKISNSPSVAANYAKDLLTADITTNMNNRQAGPTAAASITTGVQNNNHHHASQRRKAMEHQGQANIPVQLHLVQSFLSQNYHQKLPIASKQSSENNTQEQHEHENEHTQEHKQQVETEAEDQELSNKLQTNIMLRQIQTGNQLHFLKQLLILTSYACIDEGQQQQQSHPTDYHENQQNGIKNITHGHGHHQTEIYAAEKVSELLNQVDDSFETLFQLLPSSTTTRGVIDTTATAIDNNKDENEYDLDVNVNTSKSVDLQYKNQHHEHRRQDMDDKNSNNSDQNRDKDLGLENYDPTARQQQQEQTVIENHHENDQQEHDNDDENDHERQKINIIPDLLPLCMSDQGDVTNAFFQSCAPLQPQHTMQSASSKTKSVDHPQAQSSSSSNHANNTSKTNSSSTLTASGRTSPRNVASSIMSSVLSTVKTGSIGKARRHRNKSDTNNNNSRDNDNSSTTSSNTTATTATSSSSPSTTASTSPNKQQLRIDYNVIIEREMLGLTVENVLERTVVRTVIPNGAAKKAGTKVGSLIVKVGSVETATLTHFETIDELRQSKRPLKLVLRKISKEKLKGAREEMGRLIKGGGFGTPTVDIMTGASSSAIGSDCNNNNKIVKEPPNGAGNGDGNVGEDRNGTRGIPVHQHDIHYSLNQDVFFMFLQEKWMKGAKLNSSSNNSLSRKEETLSRIGAKLVWLLCLLVIGMEREAMEINSVRSCGNSNANSNDDDVSDSSSNSQSDEEEKDYADTLKSKSHSAKDYKDAAKSVSKVLHDFVHNHFARGAKNGLSEVKQTHMTPMQKKRSKQITPPPHIQDRQRNAVPGASRRNAQSPGSVTSSPTQRALLKIGDVLHRTRSFFADPHSPPAALLRGEVIALLCDVLDLDNEMALSEEEAVSSTAGRSGGGGPINDLGSAGSLLKLIVLNCSMIRSIGCVDTADSYHSQHAGNRFLAVVHRLCASSSISARVTACSLGPVLWGHLDFPHQLQLRGVITRALHDVEVIVRMSTATVLHEIAELVFDSRAVPWLVLMCERAMTDPEPQLRAAAMTLTWHLAEHLPNAFFGDAREGSRSRRRLPPRTDPIFIEVYLLQCKLLPVAIRLSEDGSAAVRLAVAAQCDRLANALGEHWYSVIIDLLQALLGDKDDRVRGEATLCIPRLVEIVLLNSSNSNQLKVTVLESLLPVAIKLLKDTAVDVRVALATAAGELLTLMVGFQSFEELSAVDGIKKESSNHKKHIDETLIPLLQSLLQDASPEVTSSALRAITNTSRGNVREISSRRNEDDSLSLSSHQSHMVEKKDPVFLPVLSEEQVLRLVPTLSKLANSAQWRVRQSAVEIVPALLGCTHRFETRSDIGQLCVTLMNDNVDAVRKTAAECLCLGGSSVRDSGTNEWMNNVVLPHIEACRDSSKSKQRLLSLKMVEIVLTNASCHSPSKIVGKIVNSADKNSNSDQSSLARKCLEIASSLSDDETVNVRLNVGRVFGNVIGMLGDMDLEFIINILENQVREEETRRNGNDRDVKFFAKRAMKLAQDRLKDHF